MCGISGFYFHDVENCPLTQKQKEKLTNELLLGIEHRGTDATGVAAVTPTGELHIEKADLEATRFNWWRSELPENVRSVLLHTRYATQGTPMHLENNHPIRYGNAVITHNGHISNDDEIFRDNELDRIGEVDSECIAALFDKYGIEKAQLALEKLDGNYAVAAADLRNPNSLVLAKGWSSPLFYYEATEGIVWASTQKTIIDALDKSLGIEIKTRDLRELYFGYLLLIEDGKIEKYKFDTYVRPHKYTYTSGATILEKKDEKKKETSTKRFEKQSWGRNWFGGRKKKDKKDDGVPHGELELTDDAHIEFWEKEPHPMAYTVNTSVGKFLFKECDGCETAYQTKLLTITEQGFIFCSGCLEEFDQEDAMDNPAVVHEVVIDLVAEQFKTNPDFVNWLLFESDEDELQDGDVALISLYVQFEEEYNKAYEEFTGNRFGSATRLTEVATEKLDEDTEEIADCGVEAFSDSPVLDTEYGSYSYYYPTV